MPHRPHVLLTAALFTFLSTLVHAHPQTPSTANGADAVAVRGTVLDPMGAAIPGADVTITNETFSQTIISDQRGEFAIALPPGRYTVSAALTGFVRIEQAIDAPLADGQRLELVLRVPGVHETVEVSAPSGGYQLRTISNSTKMPALQRDVPQSITVVTRQLMQDQLMLSLADVVRYVPGVTAHQGENNRDQVIIRGNNSSADFFLDGVRDDVQYYRDLYNLDRVEALKGPNAMIFGRGGGGGVINRVSKEAGFTPQQEFTVLGGSFNVRRLTGDFDVPINSRAAFRLNGLYENSDSFRHAVNLERYGLNPTMTILAGGRTRITAGYEHFRDNRTADRGIPSFEGRPVDADTSTFFGDPSHSFVHARADAVSVAITHERGRVTLRNRTMVGEYERAYQNYVPGAVSANKLQVAISAYNNDTERLNAFNQTDVISALSTGRVRHTVLSGVELGRQRTDNFRNTGFFNNSATSILAPYDHPTIAPPVTFRQSATDADNHLRTAVAAAYGQDQIELSPFVRVLAGIRVDAFDLAYLNNRTGDRLGRVDHLVSPRAGLVVKPIVPLSIYGSYTVSFLPGSGDQFSSLTTITEQVKPERFNNYEFGAKWDVRPTLSFTSSIYRLDRTNTRSTDPVDPTRIVQTGSQRTNGFELGVNGRLTSRWQVAGGYSYQDAFVTSATTAARAGAQVAQVPHHSLSLWNNYQVSRKVGAGLGFVQRTDVFAAIDHTMILPGYTDVDAAVYVWLAQRVRLQVNAENIFNRTFYVNADNNTNISPGSPRAARVGLVVGF